MLLKRQKKRCAKGRRMGATKNPKRIRSPTLQITKTDMVCAQISDTSEVIQDIINNYYYRLELIIIY